MRDLVLGLWFGWQALAARFHPDPAVKIAEARLWLESNIRLGDRPTLRLLKDAKAAGFKCRRATEDMQKDILADSPWRELPVVRIYACEQVIRMRPAFAITDVVAWIGLDAANAIVHREIRVLRTSL